VRSKADEMVGLVERTARKQKIRKKLKTKVSTAITENQFIYKSI